MFVPCQEYVPLTAGLIRNPGSTSAWFMAVLKPMVTDARELVRAAVSAGAAWSAADSSRVNWACTDRVEPRVTLKAVMVGAVSVVKAKGSGAPGLDPFASWASAGRLSW